MNIAKKKKVRVIAYYLPQFYPIKENDTWWGKGFTEWTNVGKAKPLFRGHYQPRIPADLGYYDLRLPEVREEQAEMAKKSGIEGFMYWHYWFGNGRTILERQFKEIMESGKPDFPFCLGWANHSWSNKTWSPDKTKISIQKTFIEQRYDGIEDYTSHFKYLLPAFKDPRYIRVDGMPMFHIFDLSPKQEIIEFITTWQKLAFENGLKGIYFVGQVALKHRIPDAYKIKLNSVAACGMSEAQGKLKGELFTKLQAYLKIVLDSNYGGLMKYDYQKLTKHMLYEEMRDEHTHPVVIPQFDRSPRAGKKGIILHNSNPESFGKYLLNAIKLIDHKLDEHRIIFIRSWNEWGEGNYLEPDIKFGNGYLNEIRKLIVE